ncbi:MAG TPA: PsbP-related protein [Nitrososphaeraceae archaeon]|nr:PsbP-related protein [Nitrososphaeraceae archaeon]
MFKLVSLSWVTIILVSLILISNSSTSSSTPSSSSSSSSTLYAFALFGLGSSPKDNNNFLTYQDSTLGIKIDYPAGWTQELHVGGLVTFLTMLESDTNTYPAGLGVTVQNLASKNTSLNEITKVQIKNLTQNHPDFKLIESTKSMLAGIVAHKIVFIATDNSGHERKAMQIWTLKDGRAYLLTYKAQPEEFSHYLPLVQKMIDSFQFIGLS